MALPNRFHISTLNNAVRFRTQSGAWSNVTLASTIAAESAYPLTNLQNQNANEWATFDMTAQTALVITDLNSADEWRAANCFAIHNHDFPDGTTVRLQLYDAINQGGTEVYDSTATDVMHNIPFASLIAGQDAIEGNFEDEGQMKTHFSLWFDDPNSAEAPVEYKSFKVTITNAAGFTDNVLKMDKLWLGWAYCPQYGPSRGANNTLVEDSEHQRKPGGGMDTVEGDVRRSMRLQFRAVPDAEEQTLTHQLDKAKMGGDVLATLDPNDARGKKYKNTSIFRRLSEQSWDDAFYNGNEFGIALEEN